MKKMRQMIALLMMVLVLGTSLTALAIDSTASFEDGKLFIFEPGSAYTDTDFFDNFKGVMPGDTRSEEVMILNKSKDFDYIKVYMRAELHDVSGNPISPAVLAELKADDRREDMSELAYMHDFLAQMQLTVMNDGEAIYEDTPDKTGGLTDNVYLGTLRKGEKLSLDVTLNVPITMGNEYANRVGEVDWVFVVEGYDDPKPPQTGDTSMIGTALILMAVSFAAIVIFLFAKRRTKKN